MGESDLKYEKYREYISFIDKYKSAKNASTGSQYDANANVDNKNIATLQGEIPKGTLIGINRLLMHDKIKEMYDEDMADEYIRQLENHDIYKHDETSIRPYTYSAKEVVVAKIGESIKLISFEDLYDLCEEDEILVDEEKGVWCKYPANGSIQVMDKHGYTGVSRLVKKKRHRDLVRVKTAFGEDLIVTDNHPLIVGDDIDNTVEAVDSKGFEQYRVELDVRFGGKTHEKFNELSPWNVQQYDSFYMSQVAPGYAYDSVKNEVAMDCDMGYLIGFFIGDGCYTKNENGLSHTISIWQKDRKILEKLADIAYTHLGIGGTIQYTNGVNGCWSLKITSADFVYFLSTVCGIKRYAPHKTLPVNIYDYTEEFALGVISGLIDSNGDVSKEGVCNIGLLSRTAIMQLTMLAHSLGFSGGNAIQNTPFGNGTMFGYNWKILEEEKSRLKSFKVQKIENCPRTGSNYTYGWSTITSVSKIENGSFLQDNEYIYDITTDSHSFVCDGLWVHNCVSTTMYPFLTKGLTTIGGESEPPKHLDSFCGSFINLVFAVASQFAGAVSTPEFLTYLDYFIRKEYGDDYYLSCKDVVSLGRIGKTIEDVIEDKFAQIVYSLNQPAAARDFQSVFWNIAYFDKNYFDGIFRDFCFPDGTEPQWESVSWLQKKFMTWFNAERLKKVLTFPVETMNLLDDGNHYVDEDWADFTAEMYSKGHSFFTYRSDSVDSLSSCCRLKNQIKDNTFSFTLGAGGVSTGSKGVITMNVNRIVQNAVKSGRDISDCVREQVEKIHCYLSAYNEIVKDYLKTRMLPVYDAGFISLSRQYLTVGINGFAEGAEFLGIDISPNEEYFKYGESILKPIYESNRAAKTDEIMFNTEFVPAENLGVKNAKWDKDAGYFVPRDCYNSYFYIVEDETSNVLDKFILHGDRLTRYLDGGSALHCNLDEHLSKEQYRVLMNDAIRTGCSYFTFNIPNTICNECGHISKHHLDHCESCGSSDVDYITRIIGYLKRVSSFSAPRQKEVKKRYYAKA